MHTHTHTHLFTHPEGRAGPGNSIEAERQAECRRFLDLCARFVSLRLALAVLHIQAVSTTVAGHKTQQPHLRRAAVSHSRIRSCLISSEGEAETPSFFSAFLSLGEPSEPTD